MIFLNFKKIRRNCILGWFSTPIQKLPKEAIIGRNVSPGRWFLSFNKLNTNTAIRNLSIPPAWGVFLPDNFSINL